MGIEWTESSAKHGVSREDALYAIGHATGVELVDGLPGWVTRAFVGHPHAQTDRYIEVIAAQRGNEYRIFHVMPLTDTYRHLSN